MPTFIYLTSWTDKGVAEPKTAVQRAQSAVDNLESMGVKIFETYWTTRRGVEAMDYSYALMDLTVYGRQELWEDSPSGWPTVQGTPVDAVRLRSDGRPIPQWSRIEAGRSDTLTP